MTTITVVLSKLLLNWLRRHPGTVDTFAAELAKRIPGGADDTVITFLATFFKNLI